MVCIWLLKKFVFICTIVQFDTDFGRRTDCLFGSVQFDYFKYTCRSEELRVMVPVTVTGGNRPGWDKKNMSWQDGLWVINSYRYTGHFQTCKPAGSPVYQLGALLVGLFSHLNMVLPFQIKYMTKEFCFAPRNCIFFPTFFLHFFLLSWGFPMVPWCWREVPWSLSCHGLQPFLLTADGGRRN